MSSFLISLLNVLLVLSSLFLILLILIQRGKGGGLAGAFGGVGGSSAFGTKAGDVFTKITIYTALVWFALNLMLVYKMNQSKAPVYDVDSSRGKAAKTPAKPGGGSKGGAPSPTRDTTGGTETPAPLPLPTPGPTELPSPSPSPSPAPAKSGGAGELPSALPDNPFGDEPAKKP